MSKFRVLFQVPFDESATEDRQLNILMIQELGSYLCHEIALFVKKTVRNTKKSC